MARIGRFTKRIVKNAITIAARMLPIVIAIVETAASRAVASTLFCALVIDVSSALRTSASASAICA